MVPPVFCTFVVSNQFSIMNLIIRQATKADSEYIARFFCMALHREPSVEELPEFAKIAELDDVLYSYRNALMAEIDGKLVGMCLCYDGTGYHEIRLRTFALFAALDDGETEDEMDFEHFEDETQEGEYYIDSLAVLPEYRCQGIATALMKAQIEKGAALGIPIATLLVDPDNPNAQKLYYNLGFKYHSDVYAFGQIFWKLSMDL